MKGKILIVLALVLTLAITGCAANDTGGGEEEETPPLVEEDAEEFEEEEEEPEDVEEDIEEAEVEQENDEREDEKTSDKWPGDFMPEAPELAGEIRVAKEEGPNKYFLEFQDIDHDEAEKYANSLKDAGFTNHVSQESKDNFIKYKGVDDSKNKVVFIWKDNEITKLDLIREHN